MIVEPPPRPLSAIIITVVGRGIHEFKFPWTPIVLPKWIIDTTLYRNQSVFYICDKKRVQSHFLPLKNHHIYLKIKRFQSTKLRFEELGLLFFYYAWEGIAHIPAALFAHLHSTYYSLIGEDQSSSRQQEFSPKIRIVKSDWNGNRIMIILLVILIAFSSLQSRLFKCPLFPSLFLSFVPWYSSSIRVGQLHYIRYSIKPCSFIQDYFRVYL